MLADIILIIHTIFVLGVILPVPFIALGGLFGWNWVRNRTFRLSHLAMIGIVILETIFGIVCPLTEWEQALRQTAGHPSYQEGFIEHWLSRILFYDFPPWVFATLYLAWGILVLGLLWLVPPRRKQFS